MNRNGDDNNGSSSPVQEVNFTQGHRGNASEENLHMSLVCDRPGCEPVRAEVSVVDSQCS